MARLPRIKSKSGIYHVMLRGTNKQAIFRDEEDLCRFIGTLARYKRESGIKIYAWCLMINHVHLVLQEGKEKLFETMKRIGVSYAWYYHLKYNTTGHLFQDRFRSESIEEDEYLLTVVRYIHQNPVKAGLVKKPADWQWSSCRDYYGIDHSHPLLLDSDFVSGILSQRENGGIEVFKEFNEIKTDDRCLEEDYRNRFTDEQASAEIRTVAGDIDIAKIKDLPKARRNELVGRIKEIDGITQRQISRILGIPLSLISRAE